MIYYTLFFFFNLKNILEVFQGGLYLALMMARGVSLSRQLYASDNCKKILTYLKLKQFIETMEHTVI